MSGKPRRVSASYLAGLSGRSGASASITSSPSTNGI